MQSGVGAATVGDRFCRIIILTIRHRGRVCRSTTIGMMSGVRWYIWRMYTDLLADSLRRGCRCVSVTDATLAVAGCNVKVLDGRVNRHSVAHRCAAALCRYTAVAQVCCSIGIEGVCRGTSRTRR